MKEFTSNEQNDNGYKPVFINQAHVATVKMCASALLTMITMVDGSEVVVRHEIDEVVARLCQDATCS